MKEIQMIKELKNIVSNLIYLCDKYYTQSFSVRNDYGDIINENIKEMDNILFNLLPDIDDKVSHYKGYAQLEHIDIDKYKHYHNLYHVIQHNREVVNSTSNDIGKIDEYNISHYPTLYSQKKQNHKVYILNHKMIQALKSLKEKLNKI